MFVAVRKFLVSCIKKTVLDVLVLSSSWSPTCLELCLNVIDFEGQAFLFQLLQTCLSKASFLCSFDDSRSSVPGTQSIGLLHL